MFLFISGNLQLKSWKHSSLCQAGLCADHFEAEDFINERKLYQDAVPINFKNIANREGNENVGNNEQQVERSPLHEALDNEFIFMNSFNEDECMDGISSQNFERIQDIGGGEAIAKQCSETANAVALTGNENMFENFEFRQGEQEMQKMVEERITPDEVVNVPNASFFIDREENCDEDFEVEFDAANISTYRNGEGLLNFQNSDNEDDSIMALDSTSEFQSESIEEVNFNEEVPLLNSTTTEEPMQIKNKSKLVKACTPLCIKTLNKLKLTIKTLRSNVKNLNAKLSRSKNKYSKLEESDITSIDYFLDKNNVTKPFARTMVKLQFHRKGIPYSEEEKKLAKHMFYHSAGCYCRMRESGLVLPASSTVRGWISQYSVEPGFDDKIF